ncbi:leucine-rich repeat-containing protein (substrate of the Dot/Icm secretion system) [Legionella busanensis]|uniref:Leucine-rich repeat-containing protein (Substrate of the Dot/Icm secretion system) n=1 Tax=Legionella busanensis TaxID=190655 RepID=A0A378K9H0_9GAMM|nr:hypothetical protein [Legionella busanensis]STX81356.1 leucine-rich repeat-containing protein (substrate of the Dot/Icm secretion system) [Legionella busanensis]
MYYRIKNSINIDLFKSIKTMPLNVIKLDLTFTRVRLKTGEELIQIYSAIPSSISSIKLSTNVFNARIFAELSQALNAIPPSLLNWVALYVSQNNLDTKELTKEIKEIFPNNKLY